MILVIDASAMVAISLNEPGHERIIERLSQADAVWAHPINLVEYGIALTRRGAADPATIARNWLNQFQVQESALPLFPQAFDAFLRFGKGRHPARLNLGDCFAYALAKTLDAPLLFVGEDFPQTDIRSAL